MPAGASEGISAKGLPVCIAVEVDDIAFGLGKARPSPFERLELATDRLDAGDRFAALGEDDAVCTLGDIVQQTVAARAEFRSREGKFFHHLVLIDHAACIPYPTPTGVPATWENT